LAPRQDEEVEEPLVIGGAEGLAHAPGPG
jgi:hypothetical protein